METLESIGVSEACRRSGSFPAHIYGLIVTGKVSAQKDADGHWTISLESFESWLKTRKTRKPRLVQQY